MIMKPYETADAPELRASVPINNQRFVIISLAIEDVQPGDIIVYAGEMELTNNTSRWAMFGRSMILAAGAAATMGEKITESNEENFNPKPGWWADILPFIRYDVHHLVGLKVGIHTVLKPLASASINMLAWAATDPPRPDLSLTVEKGYGRVSVLKIRP